MHRFYAPSSAFTADKVYLDDRETRHLRDVLRIGPQEIVRVFDGEGREFECSIYAASRHKTELKIVRETMPAAPESTLALTVAAAVTPPDRYDLAVQKAVELGVHRFIPLLTARTEIKPSVARNRVERWRRIAFEASKQCGRARLMSIDEPIVVTALFEIETNIRVFFSERDGSGFDFIKPSSEMTIVFGPKGGWDDAELDLAKKKKAAIVTFGGRILRAETAAIALTAIVQHRFGDMN